MTRRTFLLAAGASLNAKTEGLAWTQWGGPHRNFTTEAGGLKSSWPATGPKVMWKRPLGEGYSSPSVEAGALYTMYGRSGEEIVTAIDADTGGTRLMYGYASSPIAFRDTIIVPVGGRGKATMAFQQADGKVAWAKGSIPNTYSSPLTINVDGLEQLVSVMDGLVFGLNPHNGDLQWQIPFRADYGISVATPVWCPGNLLFVSAEYGAGSKMIHLERNGTQTKAKEAWASNRLRLHNGNAMWVGGALYFTSGGKGSQAILSAVEAASGNIFWQERSIQKATFVWADGKLITLDQDGYLMLADPSPKGFKVAAKSKLLTNLSWTPPVLVGTKLYLRDRKSIM